MIQKMQKMMSKKNKKGFTLIELIVVIAIIAILAAIAIPRFGGFTESAKKTSDEAIAANLAAAGAMYAATHSTAPADVAALYGDQLTSFATNAAVITALKSATYKAGAAADGSGISFALGADGRVTFTSNSTTDLVAIK